MLKLNRNNLTNSAILIILIKLTNLTSVVKAAKLASVLFNSLFCLNIGGTSNYADVNAVDLLERKKTAKYKL